MISPESKTRSKKRKIIEDSEDEAVQPSKPLPLKEAVITYLRDILDKISKFRKDDDDLVERIQLKFQEELIERSERLTHMEGLVKRALFSCEHPQIFTQESAKNTDMELDDFAPDTKIDGTTLSDHDDATTVSGFTDASGIYNELLDEPPLDPDSEDLTALRKWLRRIRRDNSIPSTTEHVDQMIESVTPMTEEVAVKPHLGKAIRTGTRPLPRKDQGLGIKPNGYISYTSTPAEESTRDSGESVKSSLEYKQPPGHTIRRSCDKAHELLLSSNHVTANVEDSLLPISKDNGNIDKIDLMDNTTSGCDEGPPNMTRKKIKALFSVDPNDGHEPGNFDYMRKEQKAHKDETCQARDKDYISSPQIIRDLASVSGKGIPNCSVNFKRSFLYRSIGGSSRRTWCKVFNSGARQFPSLKNYVCARPEFSPFLPPYPSEHGIMYDWKDNTSDVPQVKSVIPLFICVSGTDWQYCGNYELFENRELNSEEWENCGPKVRDVWSRHLLYLSGARSYLIKLGFPHAKELQGFIPQGFPGYSLEDEKNIRSKILDFLEAPKDKPHVRLIRRVFKFDHYDRGLYNFLLEKQKNAGNDQELVENQLKQEFEAEAQK